MDESKVREAMKQALEALEEATGVMQDEGFLTKKQDKAITALRQALIEDQHSVNENSHALEQPAAWVGLTDDEIWNREEVDGYDFARAIEAKLKEKNT